MGFAAFRRETISWGKGGARPHAPHTPWSVAQRQRQRHRASVPGSRDGVDTQRIPVLAAPGGVEGGRLAAAVAGGWKRRREMWGGRRPAHVTRRDAKRTPDRGGGSVVFVVTEVPLTHLEDTEHCSSAERATTSNDPSSRPCSICPFAALLAVRKRKVRVPPGPARAQQNGPGTGQAGTRPVDGGSQTSRARRADRRVGRRGDRRAAADV